MLALSLWQPWASLIALGVKQYETRSWSTQYRGPLLIHAAKRPMGREELDLLDRLVAYGPNERAAAHAIRARPVYGALIARARLCDVIQTGHGKCSDLEWLLGNWDAGRFAWLCDDVLRFEAPIACRGQQGLWMQDVPTWVHDARPPAAVDPADAWEDSRVKGVSDGV